jgi:hypothetical protein
VLDTALETSAAALAEADGESRRAA